MKRIICAFVAMSLFVGVSCSESEVDATLDDGDDTTTQEPSEDDNEKGEDSVEAFELYSLELEGVEVEDDVEYLKLVVSHNRADDEVTVSYEVTSGTGEIKSYSGDKGAFSYFEPAATSPSDVSVITATVADKLTTSSDTATATYYHPITDYYTNYYLDEDRWEETYEPIWTGTTPAAHTFYVNDPTLPNVLLIGTSISIGYTNPVQMRMKNVNNDGTEDVANVYRIPMNSNSTEVGLENLSFWLNGFDGASFEWDVIHVNFGHHDLKQDNDGYNVSIADYKSNLRTIFTRLLERSKKVVWANTTYCTTSGSKSGGTYRTNADVILYNAAAEEVRAEFPTIRLDDQHNLTTIYSSEISDGVHFTITGYGYLADQVCVAVKGALDGTDTDTGVADPEPDEPDEPTTGVELIADGDLDSGAFGNGWLAVLSTANASIVGSSDSYNTFGNNALRLFVSGTSNTQVVNTPIYVTVGSTYKVKYSGVYYPTMSGSSVVGSGGSFLTLNFMSGEQTTSGGANQSSIVDLGDYSEEDRALNQRIYDTDTNSDGTIINKEFTITIPSGFSYTAITPKFVITAGCAYIDNVSIVEM